MSDARLRRVNKEIADCAKDKITGITVQMVDNSPTHLIGTFRGPEDTPYAGGVFDVDIIIPDTYPFAPLKMKFITKVYHPNVSSQSGAICLDILKDAWSPVLTLKSTMVSLQSLLCDPQPNDPQDAEVAKHYLTDRASFNETARYWAQAYAGAEGGPGSKAKKGSIALAGLDPIAVDRFIAMGFPEEQVIDTLKRLNYRGSNASKVSDDQVVQALLR